MKIKDNYMLRKVADCYVVVPIGAAVAEFNGMINLNEVGAFLWRQLESDTTPEAVLAAVLDEYDVDEAIAKADIERSIKELQEADLIV